MYKVYAINMYVGLTSNQEERIQRHNSGRERTTRAYRPFELIYSEEQATREEARKREKYFKSGAGKEFLKKL
ncbi:MAG: GIY-YIG nuclease family protein [Ignavibacteriaceae bacterium]|nr:GIY-YIG nuclease family protein [Ignavibacteriaceae bacterium]